MTRVPNLSRFAACSAAALSLLCAPPLRAHDTWFEPAAGQPSADLLSLHLGSGNRYPRYESGVPGSRLVDSGCTDASGASRSLSPRDEREDHLELRSRFDRSAGGACWMQLLPVELTLTPELVRVYLDEIRAPQAVRTAWESQSRAGRPWNEVYRKFARIELSPAAGAAQADATPLRRPRGYALELLPLGSQPIRAGAVTGFTALSDGKPVAGLAVEFVSRRSPFGIWRQTGEDGRIQITLPFAGEWLLRTTSLDLPGADGLWRSRFATLVVQAR